MFIPSRERELKGQLCSIGIGGAILGSAAIGAASSYFGNKKIKDAGEDAAEVSAQQYQQTRRDLSPWTASGGNALNAYDKALGLGGTWANTPLTGAEWGQSNPYTQNHWSAQNLMDRAPEGYQISAYNKYLADFDKGEFTPNERQEMPMYGQFAPPPGSGLPEYGGSLNTLAYSPTGGPPAYQNTAGAPPQFNGGDRFSFNMEDDPGYQFTRDEALQATQRQQNAGGNQFSGNILTALQDRAGGVASKYSDMYRRAALGESQANYGRDVTQYGADTARNQDIYGRGVTDYGINNARNQDMYGRGVTDFGINNALNETQQNRGLVDYGIGTDRANTMYGRGVGEYGMDVSRNQDVYGRDQSYLNRLAGLSGTGQNAAAQIGAFGQNAANQSANAIMMGGQATANQWQGANNALQGTISNYLTHNAMQNNPWAYTDRNGYGPGGR